MCSTASLLASTEHCLPSLTQQPGINEEEHGQDPAVGVASKRSLIVDKLQQAPYKEESSSDHTAVMQQQFAVACITNLKNG